MYGCYQTMLDTYNIQNLLCSETPALTFTVNIETNVWLSVLTISVGDEDS